MSPGRSSAKRMADSKGAGILTVTKQAKEILEHLTGVGLDCLKCNELLFSVFDKLYIKAYGCCYTCTEDDKVSDCQAENIFSIINTL